MRLIQGVGGATSVGLVTTALAHVTLLAPNGGEVLESGSSYTIRWEVAVEHDLENWDLWYSTTGPDGPYISIAQDLPPGDPTTGAQHSFEWTVPDVASSQVRVRVQQDNTDEDYYDDSDGDVIIETPGCAGDIDGDQEVGFNDLLDVLSNWGPCSGCAGDLDGDEVIGFDDVLFLLNRWGPC